MESDADGLGAEECRQAGAELRALKAEVHRVLVGQDAMVDGLLTAMLSGGHALIEGVPGLAKTLCATTLAHALGAEFRRVQFTPDLLPGDLVGSEVFNPSAGSFSVRKGPVFTNVFLADEINRAPAKVQSALLEAMQERQVTIGGRSFPLPDPFLVIATQNPIEHEGTYPLPEAQVDRFLLKLRVDYPAPEDELRVVERMAASRPALDVSAVLTPGRWLALRRAADGVRVDGRIRQYALAVVQRTRRRVSSGDLAEAKLLPSGPKGPPDAAMGLDHLIEWGASPRATIHLTMAARARALMDGRGYTLPDDVKAAAPDVLRHRIILTFEAEAEGVEADELIARILGVVPAP